MAIAGVGRLQETPGAVCTRSWQVPIGHSLPR
jgi:hypothetical protein